MHIKVALSEEIINESLALHYKYNPKAKRKKRELFIIPIMLLALGGYLIYSESQKPTPGHNYYMALLYIAFAFLYFYSARRRMFNAGKKILNTLGEFANFEMEVSEAEIITTTPSDIITSYWTDFTGALISPNIVLLYQANNSFTMLHQSFFTGDDMEAFKELVETKVDKVIKAQQ